MAEEHPNILFCTDFSDDANFAFFHALDQSRRNSANLHILHTILSPDAYSGPMVDHYQQEFDLLDEDLKREKVKEQAILALRLQYEPQVKPLAGYIFVVRFGSPDVEIIRYADENNIQMIVMGVVGKHSDNKGKLLKTAANVSRYAHCQVVTIGVSR